MSARKKPAAASDKRAGARAPENAASDGARKSSFGRWVEKFSLRVTERAGSTWAFLVALAVILVWAATGPIFHFSDTWQLVINTGTTIVTFLMVFLIQRAQNKESKAVQLKLNEIVAALEGASNRLIDVESLSEDEIALLHDHYGKLALLAAKEKNVGQSHSVEEAEQRHTRKAKKQKGSAES